MKNHFIILLTIALILSLGVVIAQDGIEITKEVDNEVPNYGQNVNWTITVVNTGAEPFTGNIIDEIPVELIYISSSPIGVYDNATGIWNITGLAPGDSATLEIETKVNDTGNITNSVLFQGIVANATINVPPAALLEIDKTVDNPEPKYLECVVWTVTVNNPGPDPATGVVVQDIPPSGLEIVGVYPTKGEFNSETFNWSIDTLAVGETASLDIITKVLVSDTSITNTATITQQNEYNPLDNLTASATIEVPPLDPDALININQSVQVEQTGTQFALADSTSSAVAAAGTDHADKPRTVTDGLPIPVTGVPIAGLLISGLALAGSGLLSKFRK